MKSYERDREVFLQEMHHQKVLAKQNEEKSSVWEFKEDQSPKKSSA